MAWHTVRCPECGYYCSVSRTPGGATANWREHFIAEHLSTFVDDFWWMRDLGVLPEPKMET